MANFFQTRIKGFFALALVTILMVCITVSASALIEGDAAEHTIVDYAGKEHVVAPTLCGGFSVFTCAAQADTELRVERDTNAKVLAHVQKGDLLVILTTYAFDTDEWTPVLLNSKMGYVKRKALTAKGESDPAFYAVSDDMLSHYAIAVKSVNVYSGVSPSKKRIATLHKEFAVVVVKTGKKYDTVFAGNVLGYVKHGSLQLLDAEKMEFKLAKNSDAYIPYTEWDYGGYAAKAIRELQYRKYSPYGIEIMFPVKDKTPNFKPDIEYDFGYGIQTLRSKYQPLDGEEILELHYPSTKLADIMQNNIEQNGNDPVNLPGLCVTNYFGPSFTFAVERSEDWPKHYFYRNSNVIIVYRGKNKELLAILNDTHGKPFKEN